LSDTFEKKRKETCHTKKQKIGNETNTLLKQIKVRNQMKKKESEKKRKRKWKSA
jgi:hypothetical protein